MADVHVALVTAATGPDFIGEVDDLLVAALERRGVSVAEPRWDDPDVDWAGFDLALVRTTWDYPDRRDGFVAWAEATAAHTALWNPAEVLRWNTHKSYLLELEERGAPVVPTAWLARGDHVELDDLLRARGWPRAIVKPAVAAGATGLSRVEAGDEGGQVRLEALLRDHDVLVQPYLDRIETRGELSVVVVDGVPTHAVRKLPTDGDFRIQQEYGGRYTREELDGDTDALVRWLVESTGHELLVARVDLIEDADGVPQLVELEATEPDLYLEVAPEAAEQVADAIQRRLPG